MRMLAVALYGLGAVLLLLGLAALLVGGALVWFLPQLVFGGVVIIAALASERWRYKPAREERPDPHWVDTGERVVEPGSSKVTAVYYDPSKGERHYLAVPGTRR